MKFESDRNSKYWRRLSWDKKLRKNLFYAIQTTEDLKFFNNSFLESEPKNEVEEFFKKGSTVFQEWIEPFLFSTKSNNGKVNVLEFGCGIGRIFRNLDPTLVNFVGVDISSYILKRCKRIYPYFNFHCNKRAHMKFLKSSSFDLIYTFAVFKHISKLSVYQSNLIELCRLTSPGGKLLLNLACADFQKDESEQTHHTVNLEDYSYHFDSNGENFSKHKQDNWSGVQISYDLLETILRLENVKILSIKHHNFNLKPNNIWFICEKS
jgi:SAM-dependent methyltransferase